MAPSNRRVTIRFRQTQTQAPGRRFSVAGRVSEPANSTIALQVRGLVEEGPVYIAVSAGTEEEYRQIKSVLGARPYYQDQGSMLDVYSVVLHTSDRTVARLFLNQLFVNFPSLQMAKNRLIAEGFSLEPSINQADEIPSWLDINELEPWQEGKFTLRKTRSSQSIYIIRLQRSERNSEVLFNIMFKEIHLQRFRQTTGSTELDCSSHVNYFSSFDRSYLSNDEGALEQFTQFIQRLPGFDPTVTQHHLDRLLEAFNRIRIRPQVPVQVTPDHEPPERIRTVTLLGNSTRPQPLFLIDGTSMTILHNNRIRHAPRPVIFSAPSRVTPPEHIVKRSVHAETLELLEEKMKDNQVDESLVKSLMEIQEDYICPLSLEIMECPVYFTGLNSGNQTRFEKSQIVKYMLSGNATHPITREPIIFLHMNDDILLKDQISERVNEILSLSNDILKIGTRENNAVTSKEKHSI